MDLSTQVQAISRRLAAQNSSNQKFSPDIRQGFSFDLNRIQEILCEENSLSDLKCRVGQHLGITPQMVQSNQIQTAIRQILRKNLLLKPSSPKNLIYQYVNNISDDYLQNEPVLITLQQAYDEEWITLSDLSSIPQDQVRNWFFVFYPTTLEIRSSQKSQLNFEQHRKESDSQINTFREYLPKSWCSEKCSSPLFLTERPLPKDFTDIELDYLQLSSSEDLYSVQGKVKEFRSQSDEIHYVGDFNLDGYLFQLGLLSEDGWTPVQSNSELDQIAAQILSRWIYFRDKYI